VLYARAGAAGIEVVDARGARLAAGRRFAVLVTQRRGRLRERRVECDAAAARASPTPRAASATMRWSPRRRHGGFSLLESRSRSRWPPCSRRARDPVRRAAAAAPADEARRQLDEARDARARLRRRQRPPAVPGHGREPRHEAFAPGGDAANGACADFHAGFLPGAALGMRRSTTTGSCATRGRAGQPRALRGASGAVNGMPNALTRANGMQQATLAGWARAALPLRLRAGRRGEPAGCGRPPTSSRAAPRSCSLSLGPNALRRAAPAATRRATSTATRLRRRARARRGLRRRRSLGSIHLVIHRLLAAGRLP
jgi:hypothetical protein